MPTFVFPVPYGPAFVADVCPQCQWGHLRFPLPRHHQPLAGHADAGDH